MRRMVHMHSQALELTLQSCAFSQAIDPDYYGFRDEEDGVLEKVEGEAEQQMRMQVSPTSRRNREGKCSS